MILVLNRLINVQVIQEVTVNWICLESLQRVVVDNPLSDESIRQHCVPVSVEEERDRVLELLQIALE